MIAPFAGKPPSHNKVMTHIYALNLTSLSPDCVHVVLFSPKGRYMCFMNLLWFLSSCRSVKFSKNAAQTSVDNEAAWRLDTLTLACRPLGLFILLLALVLFALSRVLTVKCGKVVQCAAVGKDVESNQASLVPRMGSLTTIAATWMLNLVLGV